MTEGHAAPGPGRAPSLEQQHASVLGGGRSGTTSGWIIKILLLGAADAVAVAGLIMAIDHEAWGYVAVLGLTLVALNVVYLPRRFVPMKYLLPGLFFLTVFGIYPVLYTAYASTTNYGTGHVLSKSQAIDQIQGQSVQPVEGATRYDITPMKDASGLFAGFALFDPEGEQLFLGTDTELTELDLDDAQLTTLVTTGRTFVESAGDLTGVRAGDVRTLPGYPDPETYQMPGETEDAAITITGGQAVESRSTLVVRRRRRHDHRRRRPGEPDRLPRARRARSSPTTGPSCGPASPRGLGSTTTATVFTSSEFQGPFFRVLAWNFAFAVASVVVTFALGLLLAVVFDDVRMRGRKIYRSLVIIPYALPGFMTALVWKRHVQRDVRDQQVAALVPRRVVAVGDDPGDDHADPRQHVARLSVHVPRQHRCPAERADGSQGGGIRRRRHRLEGVPQDHLPAAPRLGEPAARGQLRLQLQQLHADLAAHRRQTPRHRRDRRDDRHPAVVGLPRRPRRQPAAPRPRRRPLGDHLPHRRRDLGDRVQVHQGLRGCASEYRRRDVRRGHLLGRQVSRCRNGLALRDHDSRSINAGARSDDGSARRGGGTSSACSPCSSPSSRCGSSSSPRSPRAPR